MCGIGRILLSLLGRDFCVTLMRMTSNSGIRSNNVLNRTWQRNSRVERRQTAQCDDISLDLIDPTPKFRGFRFLNVGVFMRRMSEANFAVIEAQKVLDDVQLYDFNR